MVDGSVLIFSEITTHPGDAFSANNVVGIDHAFQAGHRGYMAAHDNHRIWGEFADDPAHLADLTHIHDDRRDAHDVVVVLAQFAGERLTCGEVENAARSRNVRLNHHDSPGAMKHPQRETALGARDLVVIELHWVDGAAAEFVILRIGTKDGG